MPKPSPARLALAKPVADPLAVLADELGDIDRELAPWRAKIAREDAVRRTLRDQHRGNAPAETITIAGTRWTVILGCKPNDAAISAHIRAGSRPITILAKAA